MEKTNQEIFSGGGGPRVSVVSSCSSVNRVDTGRGVVSKGADQQGDEGFNLHAATPAWVATSRLPPRATVLVVLEPVSLLLTLGGAIIGAHPGR